MRSRRPALILLALLGGVVVATAAQPSQAASRTAEAHRAGGKKVATGNLPRPQLFDIHHAAGEPTLGITREGYIAITAGAGCVTSCAEVGEPTFFQTFLPGGRAVYISKNRGRTWDNISPGVGDVSPHVTSLDPYIFVDRGGETARIFDIDLNAACNEMSFSDDFGATWITNPLSCGEPVNDHQTLFSGKPISSPTIGYPKIVYYCFNKLAYTTCTKSLDGGITFLPTAGANQIECSGLNGHGVTNSKGWVFLPYTGCGSAPQVAISKDEGNSWTSVRLPSKVRGGDPSIAVDSKDNLYYLWNDNERRVRLSVSRDGGAHWSKALDVTAPGVKRTNLATLAVGAPGNVAIAYYGTSSDTDRNAFWHGYLASGTGLLGANPLFYSATVNDPKRAMKSGACGPGRCGRVLDFIDVEIAPDGTAWAAYVDACGATCEKTHVETDEDSAGVVGALFGGPNLRR
ncbi:MAG TPA: hypothetical protein VM097_00530 [Mycobacteriales bacterium]|nr:hypothetical protein [Mycobacteriales bacterium]